MKFPFKFQENNLIFNLFPLNFNERDNILANKISRRKKTPVDLLERETQYTSQLVDIIKSNKSKQVSAKTIIYNYKVTKKGNVQVRIKIQNIKTINNDDKPYEVYFINNGYFNKESVRLHYGNIIRTSDSRVDVCEKYIKYVFNGPLCVCGNKGYSKPLDIHINVNFKTKSIPKKCNLCFMPFNYVKDVDLIKIYGNGRKIKVYKKENDCYTNTFYRCEEIRKPYIFNGDNCLEDVYYIIDKKQ